jgi:hypothetical protein
MSGLISMIIAAIVSTAAVTGVVVTSLSIGAHGSPGSGGGAPAPEIGAGILGILLAAGAVRYFRRRAQH